MLHPDPPPVRWQLMEREGKSQAAGTQHIHMCGYSRFNVSRADRCYYNSVLSLSMGQSSRLNAIIVRHDGPPVVTYFCLGHSLKPDGKVDNFLVNCFCRILCMDNHPSKSKKHYFFNTVGNHFLKSRNKFKADDVKHEFEIAHRVRTLQSCEMIYFPIIHEGHWFLFIINIKDRSFVFLDTLHMEGSTFHMGIKDNIIANFSAAFTVRATRSTINFHQFDTLYLRPHKQTRDKDSGVFVMMYMELWGPRVAMETIFDVKDIPNIRIILLNRMLRSKHNLVDLSPLHSIVSKSQYN